MGVWTGSARTEIRLGHRRLNPKFRTSPKSQPLSAAYRSFVTYASAFATTYLIMPRRFASQVHVTVSRLLRSRFIEEPPAWFDAVMQYPPIPTPARAPPTRTLFDAKDRTAQQKKSAAKHGAWHRPEAQEITYLEDRVRRQFFKDHPFEAFRTRTLVESNVELEDVHGVSGKNWSRLEQRTRNPTPEE